MAVSTNRLMPMACNYLCDVDIGFDPDLPDDERTHEVVAIRALCPAHEHLTMSELMPVYREEGDRLTYTMYAVDVLFSPQYWAGFSFDETRALIVRLNANVEEKAAMQGLVNVKFGSGRVVIT